MPGAAYDLELRPATLDDAALVSDLDAARDPVAPIDPVLMRHWWQMADELDRAMRVIAVHDGQAIAFSAASHERWESGDKRYGTIRVTLRGTDWTEERFALLVAIAEDWLRDEGATTSVARVRQDFATDLDALQRLGYREDRRMRISDLDLNERRDEIFAMRERCRRDMQAQGVTLQVLSADADPEKYQKLYAMIIESEKDIPTTVPWRELTFDEWKKFWFGNPAIREDRFWVAREGDRIVGTSVLDTPVVRGVPWTAFTGTARAVRGRGIARALKYESMGQAIELGYTRVRTNNDGDNAAILRINEAMGYRPIAPLIELHRPLT
jgi:RimJ/RimL family protein N-acetyltransferase